METPTLIGLPLTALTIVLSKPVSFVNTLPVAVGVPAIALATPPASTTLARSFTPTGAVVSILKSPSLVSGVTVRLNTLSKVEVLTSTLP
jgi:hypothetical protein